MYPLPVNAYQMGWDAFYDGAAYNPSESKDWRDGYRSAQEYHSQS